ncbi:MAG: SurA N-terminal domain-containing protein [Flavobacteriaceae bacterium]|nr:SurA N-terminal domain-containing protein [Flavobacteriaceae bacterium]
MAILSKIRERTIFLILIIGMALFAFVIGDSIGSNGGQKIDVVGEVNGETISRNDFSQQLETYKARVGRNVSDVQAMNAVWDGLVSEQVYKEQLDKAGIVVGENDVWKSIISMQYFQTDPSFKNEAGLFDEEKVKEFIANMQEDAVGAANDSPEKNVWLNWLNTEENHRKNLVRSSYNSLVNAGLGASLEEGKRDYLFNNSKVTAQYVYIPYTSIADSLITITNSDYKNYINEHSKEFQVDESRSIKYVKFDVVASEDDKKAIKASLSENIIEMKNATDVVTLIHDIKSDLAINNNFVFKNKLAKDIADKVMSANVNDVVGPYEENGHFKLSKIVAFKKMPDSVKSRHIIVPYIGTVRSTSTKTKEAAKKTIDSIFKLVKNSSSKFIAIADEVNSDGTKGKGGDIGWVSNLSAFSPNFDLDFANYLFDNKKGDVQIVETKFGFHIIKIDDQKNFQNTVQLATLSRQIGPSEVTEAKYYQDAETFASEISKGDSFDDIAKESEYKVSYGNKLKELGENVPGLTGNQRQIIRWAFNDDTDINTVKRFDIDKGGYAVAILTNKTAKGTATAADVAGQIKSIIIKNKKAAMIVKKMVATTLEDIAKENAVSVKTASKVTLASPTISGVGKESGVVGAMSNAKEGEVVKGIKGVKGVFAIKVISKENPTELGNYATFRNKLSAKAKSKSAQLYNALKEASDIEDNRANIY